LGVVESKSLWASGIQYLNDTTEYKHAASIVRDHLTRHHENESDPRNNIYRLLLRGDSIYPDATVFVGSLSEAKDRLSQWRGYCSTGGGFSIGFDPEVLERQAKKQDFYLLKCEYDPVKQRAICEELISAGCLAAEEAVRQTPSTNEQSNESTQTAGLWAGFVEPFMRIAPALKNPSFEEEREWRLVRGPFDVPDPQVRFRPGKYAVIPYREFALADVDSPLDVEEIIIGPNPDPTQARKSVEYLVETREVRCKRILEYSGTYRNW
jgi:hypothetical protein